MKEPTEDKNVTEKSNEAKVLENAWAIRPCAIYKDEYDECTSIKARFHQYFIHGEYLDCTQWKRDFKNCEIYEKSNGNNVGAGAAVIRSEEQRRHERLKAHFGNTTWKKRKSPPENWSKPLPEWYSKRNENTYLEAKQMELEGRIEKEPENRSYCTIM